jgi:hypothetical protein
MLVYAAMTCLDRSTITLCSDTVELHRRAGRGAEKASTCVGAQTHLEPELLDASLIFLQMHTPKFRHQEGPSGLAQAIASGSLKLEGRMCG